MRETTASFDPVASSFERFRALPDGVPEVVRSAILAVLPLPSPMHVLDIGAGTGRIGRIFAHAGDSYVGLDASLGMLQEFRRNTKSGFLIQADGRQLPFRNQAFDVVLLMHILRGTGNVRAVINEARRVCNSNGVVVVGHTTSPDIGIDAQLKQQLQLILEQMGVAWHRPQKTYQEALVSLEATSKRHIHTTATSWLAATTPQNFLSRHHSGARFAALPAAIQEQALERLSTWAKSTFGALDKTFDEPRNFELDIFEL